MDIHKMSDMKNGWYIGNFVPTAFSSDSFEVCYKKHTRGEKWDTHYHKIAEEINFLISGKMIIQDKELNAGDIFILHPYEVADPIFVEDCELIIVKTPSVKEDKFCIN